MLTISGMVGPSSINKCVHAWEYGGQWVDTSVHHFSARKCIQRVLHMV